MDETLTLARVIENINYVYGKKLVLALLLFVLLETVALIVISKKKPEWIKYLKLVILGFATVFGLFLLSRSRIQEGYSKLELNNTTCAFQAVYDAHGVEHRTKADSDIYDWHYWEKYGELPITHEEFDTTVACSESLTRYFFQILACVLLYLVGFLVTRSVLREERELLVFALSPIVGASVLVAMTLFLIVFHVPYHLLSVSVLLVIVVGLAVWANFKNGIRINKRTIIGLAVVILLIAISALLKFYRLAGDARWQVFYGRDLAYYHYLQEPFFSVATYGFFGVSLHAFSCLFGADMLYAYFLIVGLSAVVVICATTASLIDYQKKAITYLFMGLGMLFLVTNFDYLYYIDWILSNCAVGVCLLAVVALTYLNIKNSEDVTFLISLLSFVVITTRIEGVCYIALLLSVPFIRYGALKKVNLIVGGEIVAWQIIQAILSTGVGQDGWTPIKGVALAIVGILLMAEPCFVKIGIVEKITQYYKGLYMVLLICIIVFGFVYDKDMAIENFSIFLSHFTVSKNSNSLAFWGFILVLIPLAVRNSIKDKDSLLISFILYLFMAFGISIFRTGNPLHTGTSDSFRRVLCQVMPLTVWLISYYAGENNK